MDNILFLFFKSFEKYKTCKFVLGPFTARKKLHNQYFLGHQSKHLVQSKNMENTIWKTKINQLHVNHVKHQQFGMDWNLTLLVRRRNFSSFHIFHSQEVYSKDVLGHNAINDQIILLRFYGSNLI